MKHSNCHPAECAACQAAGERLHCQDIGRLTDDEARSRGKPCHRSAGRCGGWDSGIEPDGTCTRHLDLLYHHVGDDPDCRTCGTPGRGTGLASRKRREGHGMTVKELSDHLATCAPNEDVLVLLADIQGKDGGDCVYEIRAVRSTVEMDGNGTSHTTYLLAGDEMEED